MNWLRKVFSSPVDMSRVNEIGVAIMAIGVLVVLLARRLARMFRKEPKDGLVNIIKLIGLIICAGGALVAILCK